MFTRSRPHPALRPRQSAAVKVELAPVEVAATSPVEHREVVFDIQDLSVAYGRTVAISGVSLEIYRNIVTAVIGPSGCGKSTFIRCLNRLNELVPGIAIEGRILYHSED